MITRVAVVAPFFFSLLLVVLTPRCSQDRADVDAFQAAAPSEPVIIHPPWRDDVARALPNATTALAPRSGDSLAGLVFLKDKEGPPLPREIRKRIVERETRGAVEIVRTSRGERTGGDVDLGERTHEAIVTVREGDTIVKCPWSPAQRKHVCEGLPEWMYVGAQELPVGGGPTRCVWAHPRTNAVLAIEFPRAQLRDVLTLSLAITDPAADNSSAAEVKGALFLDDKPVATLVRDPGKRGFVTTRATGTAGAHDVRIEITTPHDGQRHACFRLHTGAR